MLNQINWATVITSILLSGVTAFAVTSFIMYKYTRQLEKASEYFLEETKRITVNTVQEYSNKSTCK